MESIWNVDMLNKDNFCLNDKNSDIYNHWTYNNFSLCEHFKYVFHVFLDNMTGEVTSVVHTHSILLFIFV